MWKPSRQSNAPLCGRRLTPEQELALAVLSQAVADICSAHAPKRTRLAATAFLTNGGDLLEFWCAVAGLDSDVVSDYSRRLVNEVPEIEMPARQAS